MIDQLFSQRSRVTLAAFLGYFCMSAMLAPMGIAAGPMAELFGLPVATVGASFGSLTGGIFVGAALALVIYGWLPTRPVLLISYGVILLGCGTLTFHQDLSTVAAALGVIGAANGVGLAGAAIAISRLYAEDRRASMLIVTDASFSFAGIVVAFGAAQLLAAQVHWSSAWAGAGLSAAMVLVLLATAPFPGEGPGEQETAGGRWPFPAWLMLAALFLYTLGQTSLLLWLPQYAQQNFDLDATSAGVLVSRYWSGLFAAQLFVAWWVFKVGVRRLGLIAAVMAMVASMPLWLVDEGAWLSVLMLVFGFANLGLLKVLLSLGADFAGTPSPRLISSLLLGATCGTGIAPVVSSTIAGSVSIVSVLWFATACYGTIVLVLLWAFFSVAAGEAAASEHSV